MASGPTATPTTPTINDAPEFEALWVEIFALAEHISNSAPEPAVAITIGGQFARGASLARTIITMTDAQYAAFIDTNKTHSFMMLQLGLGAEPRASNSIMPPIMGRALIRAARLPFNFIRQSRAANPITDGGAHDKFHTAEWPMLITRPHLIQPRPSTMIEIEQPRANMKGTLFGPSLRAHIMEPDLKMGPALRALVADNRHICLPKALRALRQIIMALIAHGSVDLFLRRFVFGGHADSLIFGGLPATVIYEPCDARFMLGLINVTALFQAAFLMPHTSCTHPFVALIEFVDSGHQMRHQIAPSIVSMAGFVAAVGAQIMPHQKGVCLLGPQSLTPVPNTIDGALKYNISRSHYMSQLRTQLLRGARKNLPQTADVVDFEGLVHRLWSSTRRSETRVITLPPALRDHINIVAVIAPYLPPCARMWHALAPPCPGRATFNPYQPNYLVASIHDLGLTLTFRLGALMGPEALADRILGPDRPPMALKFTSQMSPHNLPLSVPRSSGAWLYLCIHVGVLPGILKSHIYTLNGTPQMVPMIEAWPQPRTARPRHIDDGLTANERSVLYWWTSLGAAAQHQ